MKYYIFIFTDTDKKMFTIGSSSDLRRTLTFYNTLPDMLDGKRNYILVWIGECKKHDMTAYCEKFKAMPKEELKAMISELNPNWQELKQGINF